LCLLRFRGAGFWAPGLEHIRVKRLDRAAASQFTGPPNVNRWVCIEMADNPRQNKSGADPGNPQGNDGQQLSLFQAWPGQEQERKKKDSPDAPGAAARQPRRPQKKPSETAAAPGPESANQGAGENQRKSGQTTKPRTETKQAQKEKPKAATEKAAAGRQAQAKQAKTEQHTKQETKQQAKQAKAKQKEKQQADPRTSKAKGDQKAKKTDTTKTSPTQARPKKESGAEARPGAVSGLGAERKDRAETKAAARGEGGTGSKAGAGVGAGAGNTPERGAGTAAVDKAAAQPREEKTAPGKGAAPLTIRFTPEEDRLLLEQAQNGNSGPPEDLQLHRQALLFSLSPGFDTLLSLSAVRQLETLDYQVQTVRHVLKNLRGRALLCDEVGLGKTIEAGLVMMEYMLRGLARRVLVLAPPSLVEQWQGEMYYKFNLDFVAYDAPEFKKHPRPWQEFPRIIASLDTAKRENHREEVLAGEYDLVIVDEAHHLKNHRTQAYQLVKELQKKYILLLTATPVENNLEELFNLITLLAPGQLETASSFKRKYITRGDPLKPKNTEDLKKLVREVMVRNRRSETGAILSRRHADVLELELSPEERRLYDRMTTFIREQYRQEGPAGGSSGLNAFTLKTLQREVGSSMEALIPTLEKMAANQDHPERVRRTLEEMAAEARSVPQRAKAQALLQLLEKIPEKVIVYTVFGETQRFLARFLREQGLEVAELHGRMRRQEKEEQVQAFARQARVLVSTETGSEGRNLQFCQVMVNYDLPWNPMRIEQRIGRIHRLGQNQDVFIYNLSARGTVESYILDLLDAKINMFQLVVGELDMILGNLKEKKDFETLVMEIWSGAESEGELEKNMQDLGEQLARAKEHYEAVKAVDERLLGELLPQEESS